ncbi:hypothetical protein F4777DRAFT_114449 [Nemania sp. FL0916]|nr:hypothetical protein F4777DRAFT_114449 [Nemania sp. FL0916]
MPNMPPSLSAIERSNPPPRRKSCAACIKAKRRCDLRQPSCLRCSQRKIPCAYLTPPGNSSKRSPAFSSTASSQTATSPSVSTPAQDVNAMKDIFPEPAPWDTTFGYFSSSLSPPYAEESCPSFPTVAFDTPNIPGLDFLNEVVEMDKALEPLPPLPMPRPTVVPEDPMPVVVRSPKPQVGTMSRIQLLSASSELFETRLRYAVDVFKNAPEDMVQEGGTAWSHPALYRDSMPTCLEEALGACALHRAKNAINTAMIQRVIQQRYEALLLAAAVPTTNIPELLARTHALILYQAMLSFDDSSAARTLAEETVSVLGDSAMSLLQFTRHGNNNDDDNEDEEDEDEDSDAVRASRNIPLYPLTAARALFHDWTFAESIRRTMIISFLFTQLHRLLRGDFANVPVPPTQPTSTGTWSAPTTPSDIEACTMALAQQQHQGVVDSVETMPCDARLLFCRGITLSAHLWHARDPITFAVAWRDKRHFVVRPWDVWRRLDVAQPEDIDQLGRIIMTSGMGIEEARGWFASRGGTL